MYKIFEDHRNISKNLEKSEGFLKSQNLVGYYLSDLLHSTGPPTGRAGAICPLFSGHYKVISQFLSIVKHPLKVYQRNLPPKNRKTAWFTKINVIDTKRMLRTSERKSQRGNDVHQSPSMLSYSKGRDRTFFWRSTPRLPCLQPASLARGLISQFLPWASKTSRRPCLSK